MTETITDLVAAYAYGFPLVFDLEQVERYRTVGVGKNAAADWNTFSHARSLAGPEDTFVTINNDTLYSIAQLDLSVGPILLEVPATAGRYFVLQFVSAWTENFAYIGHRATGSDAGRFLLVPPDWVGSEPDDAIVVRVPTTVASIVGRWAVENDADLPAVHALQDATTLTSVNPAAVPAGMPSIDTGLSDTAAFWQRFVRWSEAFAPAERDRAMQARYIELVSASDEADLAAAVVQGRALLEKVLAGGGGNALVNGWNLAYHSFDYNLDHFEVGALDDPAFKIADPQQRIIQRASVALGGLWGNHAYEAAYIATYIDDEGEALTGANTYRLHLNPLPPVSAFWSLTMYDVPDYFLAANPANRYSIGDRTAGIEYEDDGSLVITISHAEPTDPRARANWLPAPAGEFRPVLRMYEPDAAVLDQTYTVPAIERID
ncbi:DUF1254 domain-containing protein [Gordonia sp. (in: high G+C Gram-positive bacteria)]|uniref:DUF1254 domain-containing protein n=1 Tax=Gordonia sp. (in: high G+C Gram-positive bacteria) TaxID=84139 RepID=UPI0016AB2D5F|nr:DUF1254 domain-containing protein [Gordonia sp. (in: high G+C Gram-positive bacteria)]NLG45822.1 DUF1254 domain-containing protein [Gordonia sp. (in: high G+C Gram-positive bacteria)]